MAEKIIFAMANPVPEIMREEAKGGRALLITDGIKMAAAKAISGLVAEKDLNPEYVIPDPFGSKAALAAAREVAKTGIEEGIAFINTAPDY